MCVELDASFSKASQSLLDLELQRAALQKEWEDKLQVAEDQRQQFALKLTESAQSMSFLTVFRDYVMNGSFKSTDLINATHVKNFL